MDNTSTAFVYGALHAEHDEIRVLRLLPSQEKDAPLKGQLETCRLDNPPKFQSLSYVWGQTSTADDPLLIGDKTLQITSNLDGALRGVRQQDEEIRLWCDRICINQNDVAERNRQVQLMRHIFAAASSVNIWLGPEYPGAAASFITLIEVATGTLFVDALKARRDAPEKQIQDLIALFEFSWWNRLWTIQEALLAKQALVRCGTRTMYFETIMQAFELIWNDLVQRTQPLRDICGADVILRFTRQLEKTIRRLHVTRSLVLDRPQGLHDRVFRDDPSKWPMILHNCAWSEATDARDRVYGTLGLFSCSFLDVDYSLSLRQTYSRAAMAIMKRLRDLSILTQTVSQISIDNDLPSWVPDWRSPQKETASLLVFYSFFNAGARFPFDAKLAEDQRLELSGDYVDEVVEVSAIFDDQETESARQLVTSLKPVIEEWIRMAEVASPQTGSYLDHFTMHKDAAEPEVRPLDAASQRSQQRKQSEERTNDRIFPYQVQQGIRAPLYNDQGYSDDRATNRVKRKADDSGHYFAPQSRFAPVYKDAAYPASAPSTMTPQHISKATPRSYNPFTHTYDNATLPDTSRTAATLLEARDSDNTSPSLAPHSEVFWRTLCMDIVEDRDLKKHRRCKSTDSWRVWRWIDWILGPLPADEQGNTIPQLHWHLMTQLRGKRLAKTGSGYIALAGQDTQVGDQIWVLAGGAYPYVLRQGDGESQYRMVSTAYVQGIMDANHNAAPHRSRRIRMN